MIAGTDSHDDSRESKYGFIITGGSDKKIRFWDVARVENSLVVSGLDTEELSQLSPLHILLLH
jgi:phosphoinositide-3-kinase regulatory subunit 4